MADLPSATVQQGFCSVAHPSTHRLSLLGELLYQRSSWLEPADLPSCESDATASQSISLLVAMPCLDAW